MARHIQKTNPGYNNDWIWVHLAYWSVYSEIFEQLQNMPIHYTYFQLKINSKRHLLIIAFWSIYIYYWSTAITEWSVTFSLPHRHFQVLSCLVWSHCVSRVGLYSLHSEHGVNMPAKIKRRTTFASKTFYFFNQFYLMPLCLHLHLH